MSEFDFERYLEGSGHVYDDLPDPDVPRSRDLIRHISGQMNENGSVSPICAKTPRPLTNIERGLFSPALFRDVNCPQCLLQAGLPERSLTKRGLLLDSVHELINIEQVFLDALYYNNVLRAENDVPINPDPDGELAEAWLTTAGQLITMLNRICPAMESHSDRFGWPLDIEEKGDNDERNG